MGWKRKKVKDVSTFFDLMQEAGFEMEMGRESSGIYLFTFNQHQNINNEEEENKDHKN